MHLKFTVRSPTGDILAEGEGDLAPANPEWRYSYRWWRERVVPLRWQPLWGEFLPHEEGKYALSIEIPQPVSRVGVFVHELDR